MKTIGLSLLVLLSSVLPVAAYDSSTDLAVMGSTVRFFDSAGNNTDDSIGLSGADVAGTIFEYTLFTDGNGDVHWAQSIVESLGSVLSVYSEAGAEEANSGLLPFDGGAIAAGELYADYPGEELATCNIGDGSSNIHVTILSFDADTGTFTTLSTFTGSNRGTHLGCQSIAIADTDDDGENEIALVNAAGTRIKLFDVAGTLQRSIKFNAARLSAPFANEKLLAANVDSRTDGTELIYRGVIIKSDNSKATVTRPAELAAEDVSSYVIANVRGNSKVEYIYLKNDRHASVYIAKGTGAVVDSFEAFSLNTTTDDFDLFVVPN